MHGVLIVDKPEGLTSHDVVAAVRRLLPRGTKVGHTGTLDPFATGVLPVVVGKATRLARFLSTDDKRYRATVAFGTSTTTCDRTGDVVETADASRLATLTSETIGAALTGFIGTRPQVPPVYSAKKVDGERAYARARRGDDTPLPPVMVTAHALALVAFDAEHERATVDVHCAAGYYVRALARDLGVALGVPAHLHALRRTGAGPFSETEARPLETLVIEGRALADQLRPLSTLLGDVPAVTLDAADRRRIAHGQAIDVAPDSAAVSATAAHVRLVGRDGELLALAVPQLLPGGALRLQPDIVLQTADECD